MTEELDLARLAELQPLLGAELPEIVAGLVRELGVAIGELERAVSAGDLDAAARAAHASRNSALMLDAEPLLDVLLELESCARAGRGQAAQAKLLGLRESWRRLLTQLPQLP